VVGRVESSDKVVFCRMDSVESVETVETIIDTDVVIVDVIVESFVIVGAVKGKSWQN